MEKVKISGPAGQRGGRAVALVEVAVDDHDPFGQPVRDDLAGGHGDVVEQAEALAVLGEGVVEAAADVDGQPRLEGLAGGQHRPADGQEGEADELGRVADLQGLELGRAQAAGLDALEIAARVDELDVLVRGRAGPEEVLLLGPHGQEVLVDEAVFLEGEDVLAGLEHPVLVAEDELEREALPDEHLEEIEQVAHADFTISKNSAS